MSLHLAALLDATRGRLHSDVLTDAMHRLDLDARRELLRLLRAGCGATITDTRAWASPFELVRLDPIDQGTARELAAKLDAAE